MQAIKLVRALRGRKSAAMCAGGYLVSLCRRRWYSRPSRFAKLVMERRQAMQQRTEDRKARAFRDAGNAAAYAFGRTDGAAGS